MTKLKIILIKYVLVILCCASFSSSSSKVNKNSVLDIINENKELSEFKKYAKFSGIDKLLERKLPWDWTIFIPSNQAFKDFGEVNVGFFDDKILVKNLLMDHILAGRKTSDDLGNYIVTELTVSNKPIELYKSKEIHVKDMIVINKDIIASNGVIHGINCIMYVQRSIEDPRLTLKEQTDFPITSCCMRNKVEINNWKKNLKIN